MTKNPISWFEIYVTDLTRARKFYESVLGVQLEKLDVPDDSNIEMLAFPSNMEEYGASGALVKMDGFPSGGNSTLVYFACEYCSTEESRVVNGGGQVQQSKMAIGEYGFISLAMDTEG